MSPVDMREAAALEGDRIIAAEMARRAQRRTLVRWPFVLAFLLAVMLAVAVRA